MIAVLGIVLTCLITTAPLLIAVIGAVFSRDARRIVQLLRSTQPLRTHRRPAERDTEGTPIEG